LQTFGGQNSAVEGYQESPDSGPGQSDRGLLLSTTVELARLYAMTDSINRTPLIAGNWKMNTTPESGMELGRSILEGVAAIDAGFSTPGWEIGFYPPATSLALIAELCAGFDACKVRVGAQNMHSESSGAFTGEISADMILSCGAGSVLLGHSERRHVFNETDAEIGAKVKAAVDAALAPVLCVGEKLDERDADKTMDVVAHQLEAGIEGLTEAGQLKQVIIAYEPVWAIGTGRTASPAQAQEVHGFLREELGKAFEKRGGKAEDREEIRILYGGSVKPDNASELLGETDIDGALVGGASLDAQSFLGICEGSN
jgi:triosephosphate isomerase